MRRMFLLICLLSLALAPLRSPAPATANQPLAGDLVAYPALEVTQGTQTYKPSGNVPLVANRRTLVFFYARVASGANVASTAELTAERNGNQIKLKPLNTNGLVDLNDRLPNRYSGARQFRFELPDGYRSGTVKLTAVLNPNHNRPAETDYGNNTGQKTVTFETVPTLSLSLYDVQYRIIGHGSHHYSVADLEVDGVRGQRGQMVDWIRSAYPVSSVKWKTSSVYMGRKIKYNNGNINMLCTTVNLAVLYGVNHDSNPAGPNTRGYGMVSASGAKMRGCAEVVSAKVASGRTWNYDNDPRRSAGGQYGGHELGHILGREHPYPAICDEGLIDSGYYPYSSGSISPLNEAYVNLAQEWGNAVVGVDVYSDMKNPRIYTSSSNDLMTYCGSRWVSDFSAKAFINYFQGHFSPGLQAKAPAGTPMDRLIVMGAIDNRTGTVMLEPIYVAANLEESAEHQDGDHAIVLRDGAGAELLRYPFTPSEPGQIEAADAREQIEGIDPAEAASMMAEPRYIAEYVPWVAGTARIDLEGPGGALLQTIKPGAAAPTVTVITPNGGTRVPPTQRTLEVQWSASDPDGDPLSYRVEYTADNGQNWYVYAPAVTDETSIEIPQDVLTAGTEVKVRVSATDGVHTASDMSDAVFTVVNHPPTIELLDTVPVTGADRPVYALSQTVGLQASAYDLDHGSLDATIAWTSDRDGAIGGGDLLSTASLSVGVHTLTAQVTDSAGEVASVSTEVEIVPTIDDLPPAPDQLVAVPGEIRFSNLESTHSIEMLIANLKPASVITWNATADQPWVILSAATGATGETLTVSRDPSVALGDGEHTATITLTSPQLPDASVTIPVLADIVMRPTRIPLIMR